MKSRIIIIIFFVLSTKIFSQNFFKRDTSINVLENGQYFNLPFAGGINSAQFSEIDLNLDGTMDLVCFDKAGNKIIPFINDNGNYIYSPTYRNLFPEIHDWIILADYNCDGKNDIYTYSSGGIAIYENTSNSFLNFTLKTSLVLSNYGTSNINIYVSAVDIPAISDIDSDGDLDILTFSILGGFVEYHKNMSMETILSCDSIIFELETGCWGNFYEGLNTYVLDCINCQCPSFNNNNLAEQHLSHAGSTLLAIDIDNDNDKDLILGDISYTNLNLLINGGDNDSAHIVSVDTVFPQNHNNTIAGDISVYPASYYIDVTNDGIKDLLLTTNTNNNSENIESCWLFENTNSTNSPDFNFIKKSFLQDEMIDLGKGSYPAFFDYNGDGLDDLVVGNYGYHVNNNNPISSLALFENIGTSSLPEYDLIDRDWQSISNINLNTVLNIPALNLSPTFGDIDGDNDKDLILGDADGKIHLFQNNGNNQFQIVGPNYENIDVGYFATPFIVDVNRDGLLDLLIGEQDGTINYCPNSGNVNAAIFDTIITNFGGIDINQSIISTGFSDPFLVDSNGTFLLFSGSYNGEIFKYSNIDNNLNGTFTEVTNWQNLWDGGQSSIAINDINNDGMLDMFIGNNSGGLCLFLGDSIITPNTWSCIGNNCVNPGDGTGTYSSLFMCEDSCSLASSTFEIKNNISIFPNPTNNNIKIEMKNMTADNYSLTILNIYGDVVKNKYIKIQKDYFYNFELDQLNTGIYILKIESNNYTTFKKIILE
tara:strand:- start:17550 stop:19844 length:2295 start_codon:yes stop_codon:yes gene_type:complete